MESPQETETFIEGPERRVVVVFSFLENDRSAIEIMLLVQEAKVLVESEPGLRVIMASGKGAQTITELAYKQGV